MARMGVDSEPVIKAAGPPWSPNYFVNPGSEQRLCKKGRCRINRRERGPRANPWPVKKRRRSVKAQSREKTAIWELSERGK